MKVLVIGKYGQLATCLQDACKQYPTYDFVFLDRNEFPMENLQQIPEKLTDILPDIIVNTAAYTQVDAAEKAPELADVINHQAVKVIANWCATHQRKLVQISTDYVFDGTASKPIVETARTQAINIYGQTKILAEKAVAQSGAAYMIIRTSWMYSAFGHNFVLTMRNLMQSKKEINVVNDQYGCPTNAHDLAKHLWQILLTKKWQSGIYHYVNSGQTSWFEFATEIKQLLKVDVVINPVDSSEFPTLAKRPKYSVLCNHKIQETFGIHLADWKVSLQHFFQNKVK